MAVWHGHCFLPPSSFSSGPLFGLDFIVGCLLRGQWSSSQSPYFDFYLLSSSQLCWQTLQVPSPLHPQELGFHNLFFIPCQIFRVTIDGVPLIPPDSLFFRAKFSTWCSAGVIFSASLLVTAAVCFSATGR